MSFRLFGLIKVGLKISLVEGFLRCVLSVQKPIKFLQICLFFFVNDLGQNLFCYRALVIKRFTEFAAVVRSGRPCMITEHLVVNFLLNPRLWWHSHRSTWRLVSLVNDHTDWFHDKNRPAHMITFLVRCELLACQVVKPVWRYDLTREFGAMADFHGSEDALNNRVIEVLGLFRSSYHL